jgi:hypothetical protein
VAHVRRLWHLADLGKIQKLVTNDAQYLKTIDDLRFQLKTLRLAYEDSEAKVNKLQVEVDKLKVCQMA